MNYEFHVGDYVETVDGEIGYLTKIVIDEDFINFYGVFSYNKKSFEFHYYRELLPYSFRRIGKYDFTKPEVKKIEKLTYAESYINGYRVLTGRKLIDKINELVDIVNELKEKIN